MSVKLTWRSTRTPRTVRSNHPRILWRQIYSLIRVSQAYQVLVKTLILPSRIVKRLVRMLIVNPSVSQLPTVRSVLVSLTVSVTIVIDFIC